MSNTSSGAEISGDSFLRGAIRRELEAAVGIENVIVDPAVLQQQAYDWSWMSKFLEYRNLPLPAADFAVKPGSTEEVVEVMRIASTYKIPVVPRGGGSGTQGGTLALYGGISLDLTRMNKIINIDKKSFVVEVEAGIDGPTLEAELNKHGLTLSHYPGSYNLGATIGGFLAARGSGVVSTKYGKAENQVLQIEVVIPPGKAIETLRVPSHAGGPDILQTFVGSEGTLGVITKATMRIDPIPESRSFLSFLFPDIYAGLEAGRLIMTNRLRPATIRLYDEEDSKKLAEWVGTPVTGNLMVVMVDGDQELVDYEVKRITELSTQAGGSALDPEIGRIWWDGKYEPYAKGKLPALPLVFGTMDTVARFEDMPKIYKARKEAIESEFSEYKVRYTAHFSHWYDWGTMIYDRFYIDQVPEDEVEALRLHERLWNVGTKVSLENGGVLNDHHGVGQKLGRFMHKQFGSAWPLIQALKEAWDPDGILNPGKLGFGPPKNSRW
ncbi:MAG: FAD-binding oxidoreductase [Microbacteriaceae bacterium]|nr:FAD-binding oxidoreductase [Microbacteriaceae bacterium]